MAVAFSTVICWISQYLIKLISRKPLPLVDISPLSLMLVITIDMIHGRPFAFSQALPQALFTELNTLRSQTISKKHPISVSAYDLIIMGAFLHRTKRNGFVFIQLWSCSQSAIALVFITYVSVSQHGSESCMFCFGRWWKQLKRVRQNRSFVFFFFFLIIIILLLVPLCCHRIVHCNVMEMGVCAMFVEWARACMSSFVCVSLSPLKKRIKVKSAKLI